MKCEPLSHGRHVKNADFLDKESKLFGLKYIFIYFSLLGLIKRTILKKKRFNFFPIQIGVVSKLMVTRERCMADPILKVLSRDSVKKLLPDDRPRDKSAEIVQAKGKIFYLQHY